jgi:hypothetical protein
MVVKCHEHLHPLVEFERNLPNHGFFKNYDCNLDIFEKTTKLNELTKELIQRGLLIFK